MVLIFDKMEGSLKFEHYFLITLNLDQVICLEHTVDDNFWLHMCRQQAVQVDST
jgi:hypothetical protein